MATIIEADLGVSNARLWLNPARESGLPAPSVVNAGDDFPSGWVYVGASEGNVSFTYSETYTDVKISEAKGKVRRFVSGWEGTVKANIISTGPAAVALLMGDSDTSNVSGTSTGTEVKIGEENLKKEYSLAVDTYRIGSDGEPTPIRWLFPLVTVTLSGDVEYGLETVTSLPVTFDCMEVINPGAGIPKRFMYQHITDTGGGV